MIISNKLTFGILAHVDAGKTTLSESILFQTGSIRRLGRVDHKDAFLDTNEIERARGITIFSKQAEFSLQEKEITLLDTPGHVDFSAEMERTLQVLDYAILVISGAAGIQSHTITLWKLLKYYHIPTFLFINKMDQPGTDKQKLLSSLQSKLDSACIDFTDSSDFYDQIAMCEESLMEEYLETDTIQTESITVAIANREVFPCYFGSALKVQGVDALLEGLHTYTLSPQYEDTFAAKVYKITRDPQGNRLTHLKITGGTLAVKSSIGDEKVNQIRIYSGTQFTTLDIAAAGTICAVTGLEETRSGHGLGNEISSEMPILEPVLHYQLELPEDCDPHSVIGKLRLLEEEEPHLHIVWDEATGEIHAQLMGEVEIEILKTMILERFDLAVTFSSGSIVYKETIAEPVVGMGHFEPLRHYAEVQLLLEPLEPGSGLEFDTQCSEDMLAKNWQNLVLTHLEERQHPGVLIGAEITDMRISLLAGRAHQKHTEGGDFRQATYRAVRHGLKRGKSILLEPVYEFQLEIPTDYIGRALSDISRMYGEFEPPETLGDTTLIKGTAPVATMRSYQSEVIAYTKGHGRLFCTLKGYELCHNADEILENSTYDSETDLWNPTGSVFCSHGAGYVVPWQEVDKHIHVDCGYKVATTAAPISVVQPRSSTSDYVTDDELESIFARTFSANKRADKRIRTNHKRTISAASATASTYRGHHNPQKSKEQYLLVDGYNIIFAWKELNELAKTNLDSARTKLMDLLCNYQGYKKMTLILVFDAYKVSGGTGSVIQYHNIHVIYTKEAETADQYIEKTVHKIGHHYDVTVATSDQLEQMIIWGSGAKRLSANGLLEELESVNKELRETFLEPVTVGQKNYPFRDIKL